jgi:hypothetical protein
MDLKQEEAVLDRAEGTVYGPPNIGDTRFINLEAYIFCGICRRGVSAY